MLLSLLCFSLAYAEAEDSSILEASDLAVSLGYRVDQLDWSIAGDSSGDEPQHSF